ncbi:MAG: XRE family transcriptional regulator, partial [Candidatus Omnitrophota bacterium]
MKVGKIIRELRKEKDMTLEELSRRSGVAVATLSRIETERMTGTLVSHSQIARSLGITLPELYRQIEKERETKGAEHKPRQAKADHFVYDKYSSYEILTRDVLKKKMMPIALNIKQGGHTHKEESPYGTEKFIYVLD